QIVACSVPASSQGGRPARPGGPGGGVRGGGQPAPPGQRLGGPVAGGPPASSPEPDARPLVVLLAGAPSRSLRFRRRRDVDMPPIAAAVAGTAGPHRPGAGIT